MANTRSRTSSMDDSILSPEPIPGTVAAAAAIDHVGVNVVCDQQSLAQEIYARRSEYTTPTKIRVKIGSWNVGNHDCVHDIKTWFTSEFAHPKPYPIKLSALPAGAQQPSDGQSHCDLYVLGLQEIIDVTSPAEALRPYTDPGPANKYKEAIAQALPPGYVLIAEQQLIGLLLLVYASPHLAKDVKSATTTSVGTGLMGYMGNKGAVTAHIVLGETTCFVFINSHLAAGADKSGLERRNWDAAQIQARTRFDKLLYQTGLPPTSQLIGDEDFAFWFGDLNYRLQDIPGDDVRRLLTIHTSDQYSLPHKQDQASSKEHTIPPAATSPVHVSMTSSNPTTISTAIKTTSSGFHDLDPDAVELSSELDPASLHTTISSLLPHDELMQVIKSGKAFAEGWQEGPIHFLPTYKYDVGTLATFDTSDKRRNPSWCDRILYRARDHYLKHEKPTTQPDLPVNQHDRLKSGTVTPSVDNERVIFDYDPDQDSNQDDKSLPHLHPQPQPHSTLDTPQDQLVLHHYLSHQHILSSDHKPIEAVFTLTYQAVDPDVKAKVHNQVARLLDRNENEGRPSVTVIVDTTYKSDDDDEDDHPGAITDGHAEDDALNSQEHAHGMIDFGSLRLGKTKHRVLIIANTGPVPAIISLLDRPIANLGQEGPLPSWLYAAFDRPSDRARDKLSDKKTSTTPPSRQADCYTIPPGETMTLTLTARVEANQFTRQLNDGFAKLDDVLILSVKMGRDHFLPVRASWMRTTSINLAINTLKRLPEHGLKILQNQQPVGIGATVPATPTPAFASATVPGSGADPVSLEPEQEIP